MKKLIILSDLWGKGKSGWINHYITILQNHFEVIFYDCCELADIDLSNYSEDEIHDQFINGGIDRAVNEILRKENGPMDVLGFSIGGLIAWKAILKGLNVQSLTAVSTTRLRYENKRPECIIYAFFGENDKFKPGIDWFQMLRVEKNIYKKAEHNFYCNKEIAIDLSHKIIAQSNRPNNKQ